MSREDDRAVHRYEEAKQMHLRLQCAEMRRAKAKRLGQAADAECEDDTFYLCPISFEIMQDPVTAADGHSYERRNIERWLQTSSRSPKTNLPLEHTNLCGNFALKKMIDAYQSRLNGLVGGKA